MAPNCCRSHNHSRILRSCNTDHYTKPTDCWNTKDTAGGRGSNRIRNLDPSSHCTARIRNPNHSSCRCSIRIHNPTSGSSRSRIARSCSRTDRCTPCRSSCPTHHIAVPGWNRSNHQEQQAMMVAPYLLRLLASLLQAVPAKADNRHRQHVVPWARTLRRKREALMPARSGARNWISFSWPSGVVLQELGARRGFVLSSPSAAHQK